MRDSYAKTPRAEALISGQQEIVYELELMNRDMEQLEKALATIAHNDDEIYRVYFEQDPWPSTKANGRCWRVGKVCLSEKLSTF